MGNIPIAKNIKADAFYVNYLDKSNGVSQRLNVQPNEILTNKNKETDNFEKKFSF